MKLTRVVVGITLGAVSATVLAWLGLYLCGVFVLHGKGSLFDASRTAEHAFFIFWFALTAIASIMGGYLGYTDSARRKQN
ncbi:conserved exported hypothetical protein [Paraburkholderia ribeironis]|uniref:Transmembrane protein n=1 Tax=Paraburkholderia ribeironis TaxID=1247936 RepID=A0A1N7SMI5_9BURK|nr:conserved exported hypothetical protein [Paraburkholderia ribeironis]